MAFKGTLGTCTMRALQPEITKEPKKIAAKASLICKKETKLRYIIALDHDPRHSDSRSFGTRVVPANTMITLVAPAVACIEEEHYQSHAMLFDDWGNELHLHSGEVMCQ